MGSLEIRSRGQPDHQENGRHCGRYGSLQEGQRPYVTQQAAMVRRVVRFFQGGQGKGLAHQRQTHQQKDQQGPPGEPAVASHTDAKVARSYGLRLPEMPRPARALSLEGEPETSYRGSRLQEMCAAKPEVAA